MSCGWITKSKIGAVNIQVMHCPVLLLSLAPQTHCRTNYRYNTISSAAVTLPSRFQLNSLCSLLCLCTHTHKHTHHPWSFLYLWVTVFLYGWSHMDKHLAKTVYVQVSSLLQWIISPEYYRFVPKGFTLIIMSCTHSSPVSYTAFV